MAENDKKAVEGPDKPVEAAPPKVTTEEYRRPGRRRVIVFAVLLIAIVITIVLYAVRFNSPYRSTEDSYVHGNQIFLTPRVTGTVVSIKADDTDLVVKVQPPVVLDDGVHVQNARQEEALNVYQQTVLVALKDTENALTAYAKEQVSRDSLTESADADRRALDIAQELYKNGLVDFLRVLSSETSLYVGQDALVRSDQTVSLNLVQLYKALGGGWTNKMATTASAD